MHWHLQPYKHLQVNWRLTFDWWKYDYLIYLTTVSFIFKFSGNDIVSLTKTIGNKARLSSIGNESSQDDVSRVAIFIVIYLYENQSNQIFAIVLWVDLTEKWRQMAHCWNLQRNITNAHRLYRCWRLEFSEVQWNSYFREYSRFGRIQKSPTWTGNSLSIPIVCFKCMRAWWLWWSMYFRFDSYHPLAPTNYLIASIYSIEHLFCWLFIARLQRSRHVCQDSQVRRPPSKYRNHRKVHIYRGSLRQPFQAKYSNTLYI